ncbi:MAG: hypothetical protein U0800_23395 [Isosphaeraceae bacterium]
MKIPPAAASMSNPVSSFGLTANDDVVEIGLLLPVAKVRALMELARRRRQPVAEILRTLIGQALDQEGGDQSDGRSA